MTSTTKYATHRKNADLRQKGHPRRRKATYLALTTINFQTNGYRVVAAGHNRVKVLNRAREIIGTVATDYGTDIYADTEHKNLIVVSKTAAKKTYSLNWDRLLEDQWGGPGTWEWIE